MSGLSCNAVAPVSQIACRATRYSGIFGSKTPTCRPGLAPLSARARASRRACSASCANVVERPYSVQAGKSGVRRAARSSNSLNATRGYGTHDGMSQGYSCNQDCCQSATGLEVVWDTDRDDTVTLLAAHSPAMRRLTLGVASDGGMKRLGPDA